MQEVHTAILEQRYAKVSFFFLFPISWIKLLHRVNVKLGGINAIPDPSSLAGEALSDPANPAIVMGKFSSFISFRTFL